MVPDLWPKDHTPWGLTILMLLKLGVLFIMKTWIEIFTEAVFEAMKKHKLVLLLPSIILLGWFPVSFFIDAYLIGQHGALAIWWCVVDAYTTYVLAMIFCVFLKKWRDARIKLS